MQSKQLTGVPKKEKICGIIMPISPQTDYPKEHWKDVLDILSEAINETEFEPKLVSDDPAIGLIHERIVQNIYKNDIIICDVSSKNPNVMFELGLRLAFDKPTIIIKDEKTGYSFDTGVVEHLEYPSSLRFNLIVEFKDKLKNRITATYEKSQKDKNYSPFLKSFGKTIVPANIQNKEVPETQFILDQLSILSQEIKAMRFDNLTKINPKRTEDFITLSYTTVNKFIDEYYKITPVPTKQGLLEFLYKRLNETQPFNVNMDYIVEMINESENWRKKMIRTK